jgi:hypothetical protein
MLNAFDFRYIEALGFAHYLEHGTLVSYEDVQLSLSDENSIPVRMLHLNDTQMAEFCTLRYNPSISLFQRKITCWACLMSLANSCGLQ